MNESDTNTEPMRVGIHGAIKHGKSTFAEILQELEPESHYYESSTIIAEVLDGLHSALEEPFPEDNAIFIRKWLIKLPPILSEVVHIDAPYAQLRFNKREIAENPLEFQKLFEHARNLKADPDLINTPVTPENKDSYRAGLQGLGGYLVSRVSPTIWYDEIIRRARAEATENTALDIIGGLRYPTDAEVVRKAGGKIVELIRPGWPVKDAHDPTEVERQKIISNVRIFNDGTVDDLRMAAKVFYHDLKTGVLRPIIIASEARHLPLE